MCDQIGRFQFPRTPTLAAAVAVCCVGSVAALGSWRDDAHVVIDMPAKITSVTLYRGRAAVTRSATVTVEPGQVTLQIHGLPETMLPETLQARAQGGISVSNVEYIEEPATAPSPQFIEIETQIEQLQRQLKDIAEQRDLIKAQEQFIDALTAKAGADASQRSGTADLDLDAMRKHLAFAAEERGKLIAARRNLDLQQRDVEKQVQAAVASRNAMGGSAGVDRRAAISLTAFEAGQATIQLTYLVTNASWEPTYNVRASLNESVAQIEYDASITQQTGENWDGVSLILSTAQPAVAANPPPLTPWFVDVVRDVGEPALSVEGPAQKSPPRAHVPGTVLPDTEIIGSGPSVSYTLRDPVTVPTNLQRRQRTRIATIKADPKFIHVAIPLLSDAVYIRGDLANASLYQLLPGPVSIFMDQNYIGATALQPVAPRSAFSLHFGIDQSVKVARQLLSKKTDSTGLLSGGRRTLYDYRLTVENGTRKDFTLELWDRCPVSRTDEIQIEAADFSHPLANDARYISEQRPQGLLICVLNVPAGTDDGSRLVVTYGLKINRAKDVEMTPLPE